MTPSTANLQESYLLALPRSQKRLQKKGRRKKTAKIRTAVDCGVRQDSRYGIRHEYITDKLTSKNYKDDAIVRASVYIWIQRYRVRRDGENKEIEYDVVFHPRGNGYLRPETFLTLKGAIKYANNFADHESEYPAEHDAPWHIVVPIR